MAYSTSPCCMQLQALIMISIGLLLGLASMSMLVAGSEEEAASSRITTTVKVEARHFGHDSYQVELKMGKMGKTGEMEMESFWVVADTGSDVVWRKEQFKFTMESMPCDCVKDVSKKSQCCSSELRIFNKRYGTGKKAAKGFMCREAKVTLSQLTPTAITLGFAIHYDDHLLPGSADGIVGLNRGDVSLLRQRKVTKFSYCLSNRTKTERKSFFWFGGDGDSTWPSTPLVEMPASSNMYHIALLGISIADDGGGYKDLRENYFEHKSKEGDGVMFVDSGCSHTFLETKVFRALTSLLEGKLGDKVPVPNLQGDKVRTCFPAHKAKAEAPTLVLHLKGDAQMRIPLDNYLIQLQPDKPESDFCLAIYETKGESVMGNIMQHDIRMHFDLDKEKLSFKPVITDCTKEP